MSTASHKETATSLINAVRELSVARDEIIKLKADLKDARTRLHAAVPIDYNAPKAIFSPDIIREYKTRIEKLRSDVLFCTDATGCDVEAEQFYLLALATLESAERFMELAAIKQMKKLAAARGYT
jgi:hypothetical protein